VTRLLLAIPGVDDAVAFKPPGLADDARIAALIVSGSLDAVAIRAALRPVLDPAFIPRPIRIVGGLPRSPTGKLTREAIESLYQGTDSHGMREA
jgi:acyl-CoA synthetase (AMP-forming)/AMP-acid ligase II